MTRDADEIRAAEAKFVDDETGRKHGDRHGQLSRYLFHAQAGWGQLGAQYIGYDGHPSRHVDCL